MTVTKLSSILDDMYLYDLYAEWEKTTSLTEYFTKDDLINNGFIVIDGHTYEDDDGLYLVKTSILIDKHKKEEFDKKYNKKDVMEILKKTGYTHILDVRLYEHDAAYSTSEPFSWSNIEWIRSSLIILRGFIKKYE